MRDFVDRMVICDPYRNKLLNDGPKTDKIDAAKLVHLLKAGLIKEVYHSTNKFLYLRRVVSGYEDMIKAGVRVKNQRYSLIRARGKVVCDKSRSSANFQNDQFVLDFYNRQIETYKREKKLYEEKFKEFAKLYPEIRHQKSLPGIGLINAVKIVARVVTPYRFADKGHYLSYAGLIKLEKISGRRSYGRKNPRYCRQLKSVYKTSTMAAIGGNNPINDYYRHLILEKGYPEHNARHKACRRLAILSLGVFKSGRRYQPYHKDYVKRYN